MNAGEWTLRSRRVVTPWGTRAADIVIRNETIVELLPHENPDAEGVILDVGDFAVLPGLVALQREGPEALDGRWFGDVSKEAAACGVTTLIDLTAGLDYESADPSAPFRRMAAAEGKIRVDCGLIVPLGHANAEQIESWIAAGFLGVEAVLGEGNSNPCSPSIEADLRVAMTILAELGRPLLVDLGRIVQRASALDKDDRFASILTKNEFEAIRLLIRLCRETRCRVHLIHPSGSEALPMFVAARAEGLPLTVETCPRHLGLAPSEFVDGEPTFRLDQGRRELDSRSRLWDGLESGLINSIGADFSRSSHAPPQPSAGEIGLARTETSLLRFMLPAVWAEARRRGFSLDHVGRWLASKTAGVLGLGVRKGAITPGLDADLVIFDPDAVTLAGLEPSSRRDHLASSEDRMLAGQVEATILRGTMIYQAGQFFEHPKGSVVLRLEETQPIPRTDD